MELSKDELEKRMKPGALSVKGFLGVNEDLYEVISSDAKLLSDIGVSYEVLSEHLESLIIHGELKPGREINTGNFTVKITLYNGFQQCPWTEDLHHSLCRKGKGASHASVDWTIRNNKTGQVMHGPGLIIHLIRDHHFFEGNASPYRVDPLELKKLLEIKEKEA